MPRYNVDYLGTNRVNWSNINSKTGSFYFVYNDTGNGDSSKPIYRTAGLIIKLNGSLIGFTVNAYETPGVYFAMGDTATVESMVKIAEMNV